MMLAIRRQNSPKYVHYRELEGECLEQVEPTGEFLQMGFGGRAYPIVGRTDNAYKVIYRTAALALISHDSPLWQNDDEQHRFFEQDNITAVPMYRYVPTEGQKAVTAWREERQQRVSQEKRIAYCAATREELRQMLEAEFGERQRFEIAEENRFGARIFACCI